MHYHRSSGVSKVSERTLHKSKRHVQLRKEPKADTTEKSLSTTTSTMTKKKKKKKKNKKNQKLINPNEAKNRSWYWLPARNWVTYYASNVNETWGLSEALFLLTSPKKRALYAFDGGVRRKEYNIVAWNGFISTSPAPGVSWSVSLPPLF